MEDRWSESQEVMICQQSSVTVFEVEMECVEQSEPHVILKGIKEKSRHNNSVSKRAEQTLL